MTHRTHSQTAWLRTAFMAVVYTYHSHSKTIFVQIPHYFAILSTNKLRDDEKSRNESWQLCAGCPALPFSSSSRVLTLESIALEKPFIISWKITRQKHSKACSNQFYKKTVISFQRVQLLENWWNFIILEF